MKDWDQVFARPMAEMASLVKMLLTFDSEMALCLENYERTQDVGEESQFWRKAIIRMLFSEIEATTYKLKQIALGLEELPWANFTWEEIAVLQEKSYRLTGDGKAQAVKPHLSMLPNFRFAAKMYARAAGSNNSIDLSGEGWQAMKNSVSVRDRITHPKQLEDLLITGEEMVALFQAAHWFSASVEALLSSTDRARMQKLVETGRDG